MTFKQILTIGATVAGLTFASAAGAMAADSCIDQVKAVAPEVDKLTDAGIREKAAKLLATAEMEAIEEMDEDECMDALKDAKSLLGN